MSVSRRVVVGASAVVAAVAGLGAKREDVPESAAGAAPIVPLKLIQEVVVQLSWTRATYSSTNGYIAHQLRKRDEANALAAYCRLHIELKGYAPDRRHLYAAATVLENQRTLTRQKAATYVVSKEDFPRLSSMADTRAKSISWVGA